MGVEVDATDEVIGTERRLIEADQTTTGVDDATCCDALKTEPWVLNPDGAPWE